MTVQSISNRQARRIALGAQGFLPQKRSFKRLDQRHIADMFNKVGVLQIDSVNVLDRAHYLTLFARFGAYDRAKIDQHLHARPKGAARKAYFEYWGHEASIMPVTLYPLLKWRMDRSARHQGVWGNVSRFAKECPDAIEIVFEEIAQHGPVAVSGLEKRGGRKGSWWGWSDTKMALEWLFWCGRITSAGRVNFARLYDLPERVLPSESLAAPVPHERDAIRALMEIGAKSHGIASEACLKDYFRLPTAEARTALNELVEEGVLEPVIVEGWDAPTFMHRQAAQPARANCRALLAPFDSLIWNRERAEKLFECRYRIEIYVPQHKRQYGYYVLPFLLGDRIVARLDLKANRQESKLEVRAAHKEACVAEGKDEEGVLSALVEELKLMATWMKLDRIEIHPRGQLAVPLRQILDAV